MNADFKKGKPNAGRLRTRNRHVVPRTASDPALTSLIEIASGWYYWEQDEQFRFTHVTGALFRKSGIDPQIFIGKTRWELGTVPVGDDGSWNTHRKALEEHLPFSDLLFRSLDSRGELRYFSTTGQPIFDESGSFRGYRGISQEVTQKIRAERRLTIEHAIARILAEAGHVAETLSKIIQAICNATEWTCGARWEVDNQTEKLHLMECWGPSTTEVEEFFEVARHLSPLPVHKIPNLASICTSGNPKAIVDVAEADSFPRKPAAARVGLHSWFAFPITISGRVIGLLEFFGPRRYQPDTELQEATIYVGSSIGQFLDRKKTDEELRRFRATLDVSPDTVYLTDRASMRYVDFNERACERTGYTRDELLKLGPQDTLCVSREELEQHLDNVIASYPAAVRTEVMAHDRHGRRTTVELHQQALRSDGKWLIVTTSRNIHERKKAEKATARLARMYATLSAANEAILRATSPEDLYQRICEAAVHGGQFVTAAVLAPDPATARVRVITAAGSNTQRLRDLYISVDPAVPEGRGLVGTAFRTMKPAVANDLLADERTRPWHETCRAAGWASDAAVPLMQNGNPIGVLFLLSGERTAFDDEIVKLLERMAEDVAFALTNFEREASRREAEEALRASEERYRSILESMNDGYWETDLSGNFTFFNEAFRNSVGYTREELAGMNYRQYYDAEGAKRAHDVFTGIYETGKPARLTAWRVPRKGGGMLIKETVVQLLTDREGTVIGFRGVSRDITDRVHAEEALRASEEKYRNILENMSDGYFECDLAGNFTFFNEAERRLLGYEREEMLGMNYRKYMSRETIEKVRKIYTQIYQTGKSARLEEYVLQRKDGSETTIETSVDLMKDSAGQPIGFRGVSRDVTPRKRAEAALRTSEERYRTILESIEDAYYEVDIRGNAVFFNNAFSRLLGYTPQELLGMNNRQYTRPDVAARVYKTFNEIYRTGRPTRAYDWEMIRKDGTTVLTEGSAHLVQNERGEPIGFRGILRDVTRRRRENQILALEHAVTRSLAEADSERNILRAVMKTICESEQWQGGGFWVLDEAQNVFRLDAGWRSPTSSDKAKAYYRGKPILTLPANGLFGEVWRTREPLWVRDISEDPRTIWRNRAKYTNEPSTFFFPVLADGKPLGILAFTSEVVREPDERLLQAVRVIGHQVGQFMQRKRAESTMRESEARFRALTDLSSDWYWEQDAELKFTRFEGRLVNEHPTLFAALRGQTLHDTLEGEGDTLNANRLLQETREPFRDLVVWHTHQGERHYFSASGEPVFHSDGRFLGYRGVGRDITIQKVTEQRIKYLASHDALTGLPNRAMFGHTLTVGMETARQHGRMMAMLFVDLDGFKVINDTLGHEAGDKLLQEIAARLKHTLRSNDMIARLGGDEFVVLVQELTDTTQVAAVARKILASIALPIELSGQQCRVSASIGISTFPTDGQDEKSLLKKADQAMYVAKQSGKNRFQFYSPDRT